MFLLSGDTEMCTKVKQRTRFIHVASRETADVYIYVGARFFPFFLAVDFIRNILSEFYFRSRKKGSIYTFQLKNNGSLEVQHDLRDRVLTTDFKLFPWEGSLISLERLNINSKISPKKNHLIT